MSLKAIVDVAAAEGNISKAAAHRAVLATFKEIARRAQDNTPTSIVGFGTFSRKHREQRKGRNPQTGAEITIEARDVLAFKPSSKVFASDQ